MSKQSKQQKRAEKLRREEQTLNRVFLIFLVGIVAECYLLLLRRYFVNGTAEELVAAAGVIQWMGYLGAAAAVVGLVLTLLKKAKPIFRRLGPWALGAGLFFALSSLMMYRIYPQGSLFLCIAVPILTVLGLVYCLFQPEFFFSAIILGGSIFTLWVQRKGLGTVNWNTKVTVGTVVVLLGLIAVAALTARIEKNGGKWPWKYHFRVFGPNCSYKALYLTYAVAFVVILAALFAVSVIYYYTMWGLGIFLFGLAVYYTTKLM